MRLVLVDFFSEVQLYWPIDGIDTVLSSPNKKDSNALNSDDPSRIITSSGEFKDNDSSKNFSKTCEDKKSMINKLESAAKYYFEIKSFEMKQIAQLLAFQLLSISIMIDCSEADTR